MGDRGNIVIRGNAGDDVWLYSHWGGTELPEILKRALARQQRWNDAPYLARIIFCEMLGDDVAGETGFGISASLSDNEHEILLVDINLQTVKGVDEKQILEGKLPKIYKSNWSKSFASFAKVKHGC